MRKSTERISKQAVQHMQRANSALAGKLPKSAKTSRNKNDVKLEQMSTGVDKLEE